MNILLISSYLPYPLFSGGHIRLYNLLKELSIKHKITLVCEKREYQTEKDVQEVARFCERIETVPRKKQWTLWNILRTGLSSNPFLLIGHTSQKMKQIIKKELSENAYDLVHVETFYVMQNLPKVSIPVVLAEQNIEHLVYKRYADQAQLFFKQLFFLDVLKMKKQEEKFWQKADRVVVTSIDEKRIVEKYNKNITIVPNGVDLGKFKKQAKPKIEDKEKTILFIGDFRWIENKDAGEWLLGSIWPKLKLQAVNRGLKVKLWIVGKQIPNSLKLLTKDPDIVFDENAPNDTKEIYQKADLLLAPIRVGSGGKFKIIESMASGVPIVTTKIGIEGVDIDEEAVLIGDTVEELVDQTITILENDALRKQLIMRARSLIEEKYDWKIIVKNLEKAYESVTR